MSPDASKLVVPDSRGVLAPVADLVFNDAPWTTPQDVRFVHPKISHEVGPLCAGRDEVNSQLELDEAA